VKLVLEFRGLKIYKQCQKPVAVRYWYGAWRHGVGRQAVEFKSVAEATVSRRRLAVGLCPPSGNAAGWLLFGFRRLAVEYWPPGGFMPVSA